MLQYRALFEPDPGGGYVVTFPDFPEAITEGDTGEQAMEYAQDALLVRIHEYIRQRRAVPPPARKRGAKYRWVRVPVLAEAKIALYRTMLAAGLRKADLARRLGAQKSEIDRLLDPRHGSRLDQIESAFRALGKELAIEVRDAA